MSVDRRTILRRLEAESDDAFVERLRVWLEREDTRSVSDRTSKVSVSEALRLWTTRLKNTDITGKELHGAESFVNRLRSLAPQRKLYQFAFTGSGQAANLFFEGRPSHQFVGAVLVDTASPKTASK